jgi:hypothetical protein
VRGVALSNFGRRPGQLDWNRSDNFDQDERRRVDLVRRLMEDDVVQPNHMFYAVIELGFVVVVRCEVMGFEMTVNESVGVLGVRPMQVLRRERRCQRQEWREYEPCDGPATSSQHRTIMAVGQCQGQLNRRFLRAWGALCPTRIRGSEKGLTALQKDQRVVRLLSRSGYDGQREERT